jgi:hypothetical protein
MRIIKIHGHANKHRISIGGMHKKLRVEEKTQTRFWRLSSSAAEGATPSEGRFFFCARTVKGHVLQIRRGTTDTSSAIMPGTLSPFFL